MKRIYVAGAYSADNVHDVLRNIGRGEHMAAQLFDKGYAPFCPWHDKDFRIKRPEMNVPDGQFYKFSLTWLEVSDALLILPGWEHSKGTIKEIERAAELGIPVFYNIGDLDNWSNQ